MSSRAKRGDLAFEPAPKSEIASSHSLVAMTIKIRCHQFKKCRAQYHCAEWWDNSRYIRRNGPRPPRALTLFRPTGLGHPVVACLIRIVIANEARRSGFLTVVEKRNCFVAWDNLHSIRRKALRFSALPGCCTRFRLPISPSGVTSTSR